MTRLRSIYGDVRARLVAFAIAVAVAVVKPVTEEEWDAAARNAGWRPGGEEEEART